MKKRILSTLLALCMLAALIPAATLGVAAAGSSTTAPTGDKVFENAELYISGGVKDTDYTVSSNKITIISTTPMTLSGSAWNCIVEITAQYANLTLAGVSLSGASTAMVISASGVTLTLADDTTNRFVATNDNKSGIRLNNKASLIIDGDIKGTGVLDASGNECGIGATGNNATADITINGGIITARGSDAAGIGSGRGGSITVNVVINGGRVAAFGGRYAAGIGGGEGNNGNVEINGGIVTAYGGTKGVGIGGGSDDPLTTSSKAPGSAYVTINGGTVTAYGGEGCEYGIGGGLSESGGYAGGSKIALGIRASVKAEMNTTSDDITSTWDDRPVTLWEYTNLSGNSVNIFNYSSYSGILALCPSEHIYYDTQVDQWVSDTTLRFYMSQDTSVTYPVVIGTDKYTLRYDGSAPTLTYVSGTSSVSDSAFIVEGGTEGKDYRYEDEDQILYIMTSTPLTIRNADIATPTGAAIYVCAGVNANITLAGVYIDRGKDNIAFSNTNAALEIRASKASSASIITLADGTTNTLQGSYGDSGIKLYYDVGNIYVNNTLIITGGALGTGRLIACGGVDGAGIGCSQKNYGTANITVNSGIIEAKGGPLADAAATVGIGSPWGNGTRRITINGGTVTATGTGSGSFGIGGVDEVYGRGEMETTVIINGGSVKAEAMNGRSIVGSVKNGKGDDIELLKINNPDNYPVLINGAEYPLRNHTALDADDNNLYLYTLKGSKAYKVTFNYGTTTKTYWVVGTVGADNIPTVTPREGYEYGWYDENGTRFDASQPVTKDMTLHTEWTMTAEGVDEFNKAQKALEDAVQDLKNAVAQNKADVTAEIAKVNDTITGLQTDVATKASQAALDTLSGSVTALQAAVDALNSAKSNYSTTAEMNTAIANAVNAAKSAQDTAINELKDRLDKAEAAIKALDTAKADAADLTKAISDLAALTNTVSTLNTTVSGLSNALTSAKTTLQSAIDALTARVTAAESNITDLTNNKASAKDLQDAVDELKALINALDAVKDNYKGADTALETKLQAQIDSANAALDTAQKQIDALKDDVANIKTTLGNLSAAQNQLAQDLALKADAAKVQADIDALNTALAEAKKALTTLADADEANKNELATKITAAEATLNNAIKDLSARLDAAEDQLTKLTNGANTTSKDLAAVISDVSALTTALQRAQNTFETADAALENKIKSAQTTLQAAVDKLSSELATAKTGLEKAIADGDKQLDDKLAALTTALEAAQKALGSLETTDAANKSELEGKITAAQTALQAAIDKLASDLAAATSELESKDAELAAKDASLETFITVVCVIACVALAGNVVIVVMTFGAKRKHN